MLLFEGVLFEVSNALRTELNALEPLFHVSQVGLVVPGEALLTVDVRPAEVDCPADRALLITLQG